LGILLMIAGLFLLLLSLTPYVPLPFFLIDLFSHFVLQYFCAALLLIGIITLFGQFGTTATATKLYIPVILALILNIIQIAPYLPWKTPKIEASKTFKVLQANVLFLNTQTDSFDILIGEEQPDIIFISEGNTAFS